MKRVKMAAAFLALLTLVATSVQAEDPKQDGVFIHVSHGADDAHRLLMALSMANIMAEDHNVLVYFDISAVKVVLKDAADVTFPPFPSAQTQLKDLLSKKVTLMACPGCLRAAGKGPEHLASGIQIADKKKFFSFTPGRIISLDY